MRRITEIHCSLTCHWIYFLCIYVLLTNTHDKSSLWNKNKEKEIRKYGYISAILQLLYVFLNVMVIRFFSLSFCQIFWLWTSSVFSFLFFHPETKRICDSIQNTQKKMLFDLIRTTPNVIGRSPMVIILFLSVSSSIHEDHVFGLILKDSCGFFDYACLTATDWGWMTALSSCFKELYPFPSFFSVSCRYCFYEENILVSSYRYWVDILYTHWRRPVILSSSLFFP